MGYQFIHMEIYSRKGNAIGRNTDYVFSEARRDPGASLHVDNPCSPVHVFGQLLEEVERKHRAVAEGARTTLKNGKQRKIRSDQHTLLSIVASHPLTMAEIRSDPDKRAEATQWEVRTVEWLQRHYGEKLACDIRHEDETYYHVHAYVLPDDAEMRASSIHPGYAAKATVMATPSDTEDEKAIANRRGDAAYRSAMREWQDSYFESVGIPCGLTRLGPGRRRLTRAEWQAEKIQAAALEKTLSRAETIRREAVDIIKKTKGEVRAMKSDADAMQRAAALEMEEAKSTPCRS